MDQEFRLLLELSNYHIGQISNNVIKELIGLKDDIYLLSGDDSGLKNVWEEICVQEQQDRSDDWEAYETTIENFIGSELEGLPQPVYNLIIYIAKIEVEEGWEQLSDTEYAVKAVLVDILAKAELFTNKNIERFLEGDFEEDEEENEDQG